MKNIITHTLLAGLIISSVGCASIVNGPKKSVQFDTKPAGVTVSIVDKKGEPVVVQDAETKEDLTSFTTPRQVRMRRGAGFFSSQTYTITLSKEGYKDVTQEVKSTVNGWYIGNVFFGGVIGLLIVDPATGAMWTLPDNVVGNLQPLSSTKTGDDDLKIMNLTSVPNSVRDQLVKVK